MNAPVQVNNMSNEQKAIEAEKLNEKAEKLTRDVYLKLQKHGCEDVKWGDSIYKSKEWSEACRESSKLKERARKLVRDFTPVVGEGATLHWYTDANAFTIISVSASGKSFKMQQDEAIRKTDPEFIPGGFAGHCVNNHSIEYDYNRDTEGTVRTVRMTKRGWMSKGQRVSSGRHEHYDYNF